jgi:energy-converting hydrogenase Eha subunit B
VTAAWDSVSPTQSGQGTAVFLTTDTGYFWFFGSTNVEVVIKVLNACGVNTKYWVFAAGLTNVHVVLTVTDLQNSTVKTYINPQNTKYDAVQDTSAFSTCP